GTHLLRQDSHSPEFARDPDRQPPQRCHRAGCRDDGAHFRRRACPGGCVSGIATEPTSTKRRTRLEAKFTASRAENVRASATTTDSAILCAREAMQCLTDDLVRALATRDAVAATR